MNLHTQRLRLREATEADTAFFLKLLNEPSYLKMIRDSGVRSEADALAFIREKYLRSYADHGYGLYVLTLRCGVPVGIAGFVIRPGLEFPDLGFALLEEFTGQGYVTEASEALLVHGKRTLGFKTIAALTTEDNERSVRTLLRLGFEFKRRMKVPSSEKDFSYYEV